MEQLQNALLGMLQATLQQGPGVGGKNESGGDEFQKLLERAQNPQDVEQPEPAKKPQTPDKEEPAKAEDNVQAGVEAMHAAKALGQTISPLYDNRQFTLITLCVDGDRYIANDTMRKVYDGLKRGESWLAGDLIASYCEAQGIRWGTIQGISIDHYAHGKNGENGGHFIVQGYVALREPD